MLQHWVNGLPYGMRRSLWSAGRAITTPSTRLVLRTRRSTDRTFRSAATDHLRQHRDARRGPSLTHGSVGPKD